MNKYSISFLFVFLLNFIFSQEIVFSGLSDCDVNVFPAFVRERIVERHIIDDTLNMTIGFKANCCIETNPSALLSNDTLYLSTNNVSSDWCMCDCCFEMDLRISGISDTNFILNVDGKVFLTHLSYRIMLPDEYIFDEQTPINRGNQNNLAIGLWRTFYENSKQIKFEEYYSEEWDEPIRVWYKSYDINGNLTSIGIRTRPNGPMMVLEPLEYFRILNYKK